ncbi:MAG: DUF2231 domain-containing protein [Bacillota bacterium]
MATNNGGGHGHPQSTARIGGHPVHPMLVPFPIVCFIGAFLTDLAYLNSGGHMWAVFGRALLLAGLVTAALAAAAGLTDFLGEKRIQGPDAVKHMLANVAAVVVELVNLVVRWNNDGAIAGLGVYLSGLAVVLLLYSGCKGGDLVYRHGMGVRDGGEL